MSKATQNSRVLHYMEEHGSISAYEAVLRLHITRLAARIHDLKKSGYKINRWWVVETDEDGEVVRYVRYRKAV